MVWATFTWASLGTLVVVEHTMTAADYFNIIVDQLHPFRAAVFPTGNEVFHQDSALCHKAGIVLQWFKEHAAEFQLMSSQPNSRDINRIEHIWDLMEQQLRPQQPPPCNICELCDHCLHIWYNLPLAT